MIGVLLVWLAMDPTANLLMKYVYFYILCVHFEFTCILLSSVQWLIPASKVFDAKIFESVGNVILALVDILVQEYKDQI